jgi:predicted aldo/keto reductase-like oxidoreductase
MFVALSGMSTMAQVKENVELFSSRYEPMSGGDKEILKKAVAAVADMIPCTECRYCTEDCPKQLDIPRLISMYNEACFGAARILRTANETLGEDGRPSACIACGVCAKLCPQGIDIPGVLARFSEAIEKAAAV